MTAPSSPVPQAGPCPACGAPASGRFCSACGATLSPRACRHCGATLSPQAHFCHRCGEPAEASAPAARAAGTERLAWLVAASLCAILIGAIVWRVERDQPAPAIPQMANPGAGGAEASGTPSGPAPDISQMSPRERFDRLFNRIMEAAQRGDSAQVLRFTPMALGAYTQLDTIDADARYHAAVLRLQTGDLAGARALADTILRQHPGHLLGYVVLGSAAELAGDSAAAERARRDFASHYAAESAAGRPEYRDHAPVIEEFKSRR
ncbi:MAG TPA: zinc ribbon domain-containing protein [Gemmatimonadales bacterium]|nr:zinc ribbon domain-containing protein [Gemmatimonadales bacterium]